MKQTSMYLNYKVSHAINQINDNRGKNVIIKK